MALDVAGAALFLFGGIAVRLSSNEQLRTQRAKKIMTIKQLMIVGVLGSALLVPPLSAGESPAVSPTDKTVVSKPTNALERLWTRDRLTGDWFGVRTSLADRGITLDVRLSQYYQGVASGGVSQNGAYGGTVDYRVNIDAHKLGLWEGFSLNMHARTRFGSDVNSDAGSFALQNTGMLMPLPGDYHGTNITGLTASQFFPLFAGRVGNVTVGKLDMIDTLTGLFPWVGYGQDGFMNANGMLPILPWIGAVQGLSLWGGSLMTVNTKYKMPESGIIVAGTQNVTTSWDVADSFEDGVWMAGFHRFFWGDPDGKIGHITVMADGSTKSQASNDRNDIVFIPGQGLATEQKNPWDISAFLYQEFWRAEGNPDRKANFVIGGNAGPDNPQFAQWTVFANVEAHGPLEVRPNDRIGVAGWYSGLSDNFKELASPVVDLRDTWGVELYYNVAINKWLHVTADIQFVMNERANDDIAVIPGVRMVMDF